MGMGKLHKIRKAIEADPEAWVYRWGGVVTLHRQVEWRKGKPVPSHQTLCQWHSYAKFIEAVLGELGYGRGSGLLAPINAMAARAVKRVIVQPGQRYEELGIGVGKSDSAEQLLGVCHSGSATAGQVTTGIMQVQPLPPISEKVDEA